MWGVVEEEARFACVSGAAQTLRTQAGRCRPGLFKVVREKRHGKIGFKVVGRVGEHTAEPGGLGVV